MKRLLSALMVLFFCCPVQAYDIYQQGYNQCVAYAVSNAIKIQTGQYINPKWLYRECKKIDGIKAGGTTVRIALGIAMRERWIAHCCKIEINAVKEHLDNGKLVIITSTVESKNWHDRDDLILPSNDPSIYNHTTFLTGYDDERVRMGHKGFYDGVNSWGGRWGNNGTFQMAYDYFTIDHIKEAWVF